MAERLDLDAFQQQLAQRLAATGGQAQSANWLALSHAGHRLLLPLTHAGEIFPPAPIQPLPYVKEWVCGVTTLRGGLFTVLDLLGCLGLEPAGEATPAHFVSFSPSLGVNAVWPVHRLLGLRGASEFSAVGEAAHAAPSHPALRQVLRDAEGLMWLELDLRVLATLPDFLDIHRRGAAGQPGGWRVPAPA